MGGWGVHQGTLEVSYVFYRLSCPRVVCPQVGGPRVDNCGCGVGTCASGSVCPDVLSASCLAVFLPCMPILPGNALLAACCVPSPTLGVDSVSPGIGGSPEPL